MNHFFICNAGTGKIVVSLSSFFLSMSCMYISTRTGFYELYFMPKLSQIYVEKCHSHQVMFLFSEIAFVMLPFRLFKMSLTSGFYHLHCMKKELVNSYNEPFHIKTLWSNLLYFINWIMWKKHSPNQCYLSYYIVIHCPASSSSLFCQNSFFNLFSLTTIPSIHHIETPQSNKQMHRCRC